MSISTEVRRMEYTGNGTVGPFAYTFRVFAGTDLAVYVAGILKTFGTHYTVSNVGIPTGGNVTFTAGNEPANGASVILLGNTPNTQTTELQEQGPFPAQTVEDMADRGVILAQQVDERVDRAPTLPAYSPQGPVTLDELVSGKVARAAASLDRIEWVDFTSAGTYVDPVTTRGDMIRGNASGDQERFAKGAFGAILAMDANYPGWQAAGANGNVVVYDSSQTRGIKAIPIAPRGYIFGLTMSNYAGDATNDIDITAGDCAEDNSSVLTRALISPGALTKQLDVAWAVGTNQGMRDTGAIANGTWHIWAIRRSDTGVSDILASLSATAPTMPTNYDQKRRVGAILREAAALVAFVQYGNYFWRKSSVQDVSVGNPGTAAVTRTLSVPTGFRVGAFGYMRAGGHATLEVEGYLRDLAQNDDTPGGGAGGQAWSPPGNVQGVFQFGPVWTNTSAQIRSRLSASDANTTLMVDTHGWIDSRGRDE